VVLSAAGGALADLLHSYRYVFFCSSAGGGLRLAIAGVLIGVALSLAAGRFISTLLFGVRATDPMTFSAVAAALLATAVLAAWIPARRATRVDPMVALRYE
jgi:ABC-type antimicrobial peptide transport system permease subunit